VKLDLAQVRRWRRSPVRPRFGWRPKRDSIAAAHCRAVQATQYHPLPVELQVRDVGDENGFVDPYR